MTRLRLENQMYSSFLGLRNSTTWMCTAWVPKTQNPLEQFNCHYLAPRLRRGQNSWNESLIHLIRQCQWKISIYMPIEPDSASKLFSTNSLTTEQRSMITWPDWIWWILEIVKTTEANGRRDKPNDPRWALLSPFQPMTIKDNQTAPIQQKWFISNSFISDAWVLLESRQNLV